jgi:CHASE2 domain-containing sensor protein
MRSAELGLLQGKPWLRTWSATIAVLWSWAAAVAMAPATQIDVRTPLARDEARNGTGLHFITISFPALS